MKSIIFVLCFMVLSCLGDTKFPSIEELKTQLKQTECLGDYTANALTAHSIFWGIRESAIKEYGQILAEENDKSLVMTETVIRPSFDRSIFQSTLVAGKKIYYYTTIRTKSENSMRITLHKYTLLADELKELKKRILATKDIKGKCIMETTNPSVLFFTVWDDIGNYRIFLTGSMVRRTSFQFHRGWDYFDSVENALELRHYIGDIIMKPEAKPEIKEYTKSISDGK